MASFKILTHNGRSNGVFDYDYLPKCPLAPGMSSKLTVTFHCSSFEDVHEIMTIVKENKKLDILVYVENQIPLLQCKYLSLSPLSFSLSLFLSLFLYVYIQI